MNTKLYYSINIISIILITICIFYYIVHLDESNQSNNIVNEKFGWFRRRGCRCGRFRCRCRYRNPYYFNRGWFWY